MWSRFLLAFTILTALEGQAQTYPAKPVRIVVPSSPGGGADIVSRVLSAPLAAALGQPFVVENRVTSGGTVAIQQVAESPPDGHTLLIGFDTIAINPYLFKGLKWDPIRDFAPVMQICRLPQVLLVHPSLGVKSVSEFVQLAKEKGASLNYGSAGPASSSRLAYELFKKVAGIETVAVHYRGGGPAMQDLIGGQVQVMLIQAGGAILPQVRAGKLTALAVSTPQRSRFFPELPTIAETYPGFASESWVAMFAPAGTPPAVIGQIHAAAKKSLAEPAVKERLEAQNCDVVASSPAELAAVIKSDQAKWEPIIREQKITAD